MHLGHQGIHLYCLLRKSIPGYALDARIFLQPLYPGSPCFGYNQDNNIPLIQRAQTWTSLDVKAPTHPYISGESKPRNTLDIKTSICLYLFREFEPGYALDIKASIHTYPSRNSKPGCTLHAKVSDSLLVAPRVSSRALANPGHV